MRYVSTVSSVLSDILVDYYQSNQGIKQLSQHIFRSKTLFVKAHISYAAFLSGIELHEIEMHTLK